MAPQQRPTAPGENTAAGGKGMKRIPIIKDEEMKVMDELDAAGKGGWATAHPEIDFK